VQAPEVGVSTSSDRAKDCCPHVLPPSHTEAKGPFVRAAMVRAEEWAQVTGWGVPRRRT